MNEQEPIFRLFFYKDLPERLNDRIVESIKMVKNTYDLDVNIVYIHASLEKITPKIDGILIKVDKYLPNQYHLIVGREMPIAIS